MLLGAASCTKSEPEDIVPAVPEPDSEAQMVHVEIDATAGSETKATYDENLHAYWEAGDQILAVQGSASSKNSVALGATETCDGMTLSINGGEYTNKAVFAGDIEVKDNSHNRYFHFAYPSSAAALHTETHIPATIFGSVTTTTTCTYTITPEQDGLWHPFLCASTAGHTTAEAIDHISFGTSRNACFAVRVFESNGKTPKRIKSITITAENGIVGTLSATTDNDGSFADKTFDAAGSGNTITADNLQNIEPLNGLYEYRFEVLPVNSGKIYLLLNDEDGSSIERIANAKEFKANYRSGVNVAWDKAGIKMNATTWFDDSCAKGELSALGSKTTIYCDISTFGVTSGNIAEKGIIINGDTEHPYIITDAGTKFHTEIAARNGNGEYTVLCYIKLKDESEPLTSEEQKVYIVDEEILPVITSHTIRSSYNTNGEIAKTNDINGNIIKASVGLNDCWASNNLVNSVTLLHGGFSDTMEIGAEFTTGELEYRSYDDCYIEVAFKNGYTLKTPAYTINVTGIPYYWINSETSVKGSSHGDTISGTTMFFAPTDNFIAKVVYNVVLDGRTSGTTGTLTVGGKQIFSEQSYSGLGNTRTKTIEGSQDITITTGSIDYSYHNSYGLGSTHSIVYKIGIEY